MPLREKDVPPECWAKLLAAAAQQGTAARPLAPMDPLPEGRGVRPPSAEKSRPSLVEAAFVPPATWVIPVYVVAGDNARGKSKIGRAGHERRAVFRQLARYHREIAPFAERAQAGFPLRCRLVRLGGNAMDSDNVTAALKYVRDAVAAFLGCDDGPRGPVTWECDAEPGGAHGVRVDLLEA